MAQQKSSILFNGNESAKELAQKIADMQRQHDNRIAMIEGKIKDLENRLSEIEN